MTWMAKWAGGFPMFLAEAARQPRHRRRRPHLRRLRPRRHRRDGRPLPRAHRRRRPPPGRGGRRHHRHAPHRRRRLGGRRADPPLRRAPLVVRPDRHRRQPLGAAPGPPRDRPADGGLASPTATTAPSTRRSSCAPPTAPPWRGSGNVGPAVAAGARPPGPWSGTTSRRWRRRWPPATWRCSSPSRRSPTSASSCPSPASSTASARSATAPARCCSSTRPTRSRPGPAAARRPGGCDPTSSRSASRSPAASRSAPTGCPPTVADRLHDAVVRTDADLVDVGGVGGTLAGNALSLAAARATLGEVLTDEAFVEMIALATRFTAGVQATLDRHDLPWSRRPARRPGRVPLRPARRRAPAPSRPRPATTTSRSTSTSALANRGILLTPFHNMALMAPTTTDGRRRPPHRGVRGGCSPSCAG